MTYDKREFSNHEVNTLISEFNKGTSYIDISLLLHNRSIAAIKTKLCRIRKDNPELLCEKRIADRSLSPQTIRTVLRAIENGMLVKDAAEAFGINRTTILRHKKKAREIDYAFKSQIRQTN